MLRLRFVSLCAIATVLFASTLLKAQQAAVSPRIVAPIDESKLIALPGGVPLLARSKFDLGRAPSSTQMTSVRLVLSRSLQQEATLKKFMAEQLEPASPNYRKWLTPDQFGKLYGISDADIQVLVTWLESQGFTVQPVPQGRVSIAFSGSVSQIEAAFHTEIHSFHANEQEFFSNISAPKIPSALAPVVSGVAGLNTIKPRAHNISAKSGMYDPQQKRFVPVDSYISGATPLLTIGSATSGYELFVVPSDAATIYDTPNFFNSGYNFLSSSYTGAGVTIGIGGDAPIQSATVVSYRSQFLGDSTQPTITTVGTAPTSTGDTDEAYIDTELSGGVAPGAAINFYTAVNLSDAIFQAIEDNKVDIFSLSFGNCEANLTTADNQLINSWWQQAAAQGIAVTVSTGDSGAAGCDNDNTEQVAQFGLQVNGFASTPYNIAVGGTDFPVLLSDFNGYVRTSNGTYYGSAVGYIPESSWNDSAVTDGPLAQNVPYQNSKSQTDIVGGSGGASSCSTNANNATNTTIATCTSGYAKPSWQTGVGVPADGVRDLPDISIFASNGFDGASWLVCTDGTFTQNGVTYTTNCETQSGGSFSFTGYGGTSTSAPAFAGILALVQQKTGSRLGLAAQTLYQLYNGPHASAVFRDSTTGNISVPCTSSTPNCSKNSAGYYFLTGYDTTAGYDFATGLGSVDATQLINYWQSPSGTQTATVTLGSSIPSTVSVADSFSVPVTVSGTASAPTGSVVLTITSIDYPNNIHSTTQPLTNGTASFTVPLYSLHQGSEMMYVTYGGDGTYSPATSENPDITVNPITPTVTVTPSSTTVNGAAPFTLVVTVTGPAGAPVPTGTAEVWADNRNILAAQTLVKGSYTFTVPANTLTAGSTSIEVDYGSDATYGYASATTTVTVTVPTFTFTGPTTQPTINSQGGTASSSIAISSNGSYSGSIALTCLLTGSPVGAASLPTCSIANSPVTLSSSTTSAMTTVNFSTTAASAVPGSVASSGSGKSGWAKAGAATALAFLVFLGIPARRRVWRAIVGVLVLIAAIGTLSACGGANGGGGNSGGSTGTTAGIYTFTITGTGTPAVSPAPTTTITLTVN